MTESVLARLHFVVRMPVGEAMGEMDIRSLERELTLATRSWDDEFADQVSGSMMRSGWSRWWQRCPRATRRTTPPGRRSGLRR